MPDPSPHKDESQTAEKEGRNDVADTSSTSARDLGDSTKAWMRRLEAIPDGIDGKKQDTLSKFDSVMADVEYTHNEAEEVEMQATGPTDDDTIQHAERISLEAEMVEDFQAMDTDDVPPSAAGGEEIHRIPNENVVRNEDNGSVTVERATELDRLHFADDKEGHATQHEEWAEDDVESTSRQLQHWYEDGRASMSSDEVWQLYEGLTRELSFSLTESLRLILEPTLATRLRGDYRTGKRLNMKKIIPYIASDFTKDKIWLRRTRPSQREYQILLALDDSRSMADSHSVHLAYQTLALVSQALTRLEAGEISICRFGESVEFIHNFEDGPVSGSIGSSIVDAFTFSQRSTDVRQLLRKSLERLAGARENRRGSSVDLWQMEIIISDGICQDLDDLRSLLRKAMEQKVMVVFVVVDSLHQQATPSGAADSGRNSILSMNSVSYVRGKNGELELKMERYMDTFPFDYYVVLRDVETLPDVLSETLRQFFARVAGDR
ncbi:MAG: hypothetical protein CYPHOPRED_000931 [Cyphobasidiales sp. Tagirdzhanova-0007]|nr:MAG: hypothetical protein CYPHOPRED_000931 [Cyphobasidiales sp. Tagirdzhanova-0007]